MSYEGILNEIVDENDCLLDQHAAKNPKSFAQEQMATLTGALEVKY